MEDCSGQAEHRTQITGQGPPWPSLLGPSPSTLLRQRHKVAGGGPRSVYPALPWMDSQHVRCMPTARSRMGQTSVCRFGYQRRSPKALNGDIAAQAIRPRNGSRRCLARWMVALPCATPPEWRLQRAFWTSYNQCEWRYQMTFTTVCVNSSRDVRQTDTCRSPHPMTFRLATCGGWNLLRTRNARSPTSSQSQRWRSPAASSRCVMQLLRRQP
jgi:hypothetical protein